MIRDNRMERSEAMSSDEKKKLIKPIKKNESSEVPFAQYESHGTHQQNNNHKIRDVTRTKHK